MIRLALLVLTSLNKFLGTCIILYPKIGLQVLMVKKNHTVCTFMQSIVHSRVWCIVFSHNDTAAMLDMINRSRV